MRKKSIKARRFISEVLVLVIMASIFTGHIAMASTAVSDTALFDLKSFDILRGDENGELGLDNKITRAEFSAMLIRLLGWSDSISYSKSENPFDDVTPNDWFYNDVIALKSLKIINGISPTEFAPNENVTDEQAVKMLVASLGYDVVANSKGGYPKGYMAVAMDLGLLKKVNNDEAELTRADVAMMMYNALDVSLVATTTNSIGNVTDTDEDNLRIRHTNLSRNEKLIYSKGIITANYQLGLISDIPAITEGQVEINNTLFYIGNTEAEKYLGMEVDYYAYKDDNDEYTLTNIKLTNKNTVVTIDSEDFVSATDDYKINYISQETDKEKTATLDKSTITYVKNFQVIRDYVISDIALENGNITLIDNTGDGKYDVVFVEDYESFCVSKLADNNIYFQNNKTFMGSNFIEAYNDDTDVKYIFQNKDGAVISNDELSGSIHEDTVVSLLISEDKSVVKCIASNDMTVGRLQGYNLGEHEITVDGTVYKFDRFMQNDSFNISLGSDVTVYLDFLGKACYVKKAVSGGEKYGYVVRCSIDDSDEFLNVKMLLPGTLKVDEDIDDSDEDNIVKTPTLKCKNDSVEVMKLSTNAKVKGDDVTYSGNESIIDYFNKSDDNRLVKYRLNSDGEIYYMEAPVVYGSGIDREYNAYERIFGKTGTGAFAINDASVGICVPKNEVEQENDYKVTVELNNAQTYSVRGYNINQDDLSAELIVITTDMNYSATESVNTNSKIAVMQEANYVLVDGETRQSLVFYSESEEKEMLIKEDNSIKAETLGNLSSGTVFYYTYNANDEIDSIEIVADLSEDDVYYEGSFSTDLKIVGNILSITYNQIAELQNRRVDIVSLCTNEEYNETTAVDVNVRNRPVIYIYNHQNGEVSVGSIDDISPTWANSTAKPNKMFVHITYGTIRGIVVIK